MLQVYNYSPFKTERAVLLDKSGSQVWVVAIKGTYAFDPSGNVALAEEQEAVCVGPEYFGEPGQSSLRREAELTATHPGTDVTFNAAAYPPGGRAATSARVVVEVSQLHKELLVMGDRQWRRGPLGVVASDPEPFLRMPIRYERAFGGGKPPAFEAQNPVGVGHASSADDAVGRPLPNIEDPAQPIRSATDRPRPAGFTAIAPGWSPRRELAGTFDDAWKHARAPHWPDDHNPLFHRSAPVDLWSEQPLRGGERLEMTGLTPSGRLTLRLPREGFIVETHVAGRRFVHEPPPLDRVVVDVDEQRLLMVWCTRLSCGTRVRQVEFTSVDLKRRLA